MPDTKQKDEKAGDAKHPEVADDIAKAKVEKAVEEFEEVSHLSENPGYVSPDEKKAALKEVPHTGNELPEEEAEPASRR